MSLFWKMASQPQPEPSLLPAAQRQFPPPALVWPVPRPLTILQVLGWARSSCFSVLPVLEDQNGTQGSAWSPKLPDNRGDHFLVLLYWHLLDFISSLLFT